MRVHGPPRLHFDPPKLLSFDFNANADPDPGPAFHCNMDLDTASQNNADPDSQPS